MFCVYICKSIYVHASVKYACPFAHYFLMLIQRLLKICFVHQHIRILYGTVFSERENYLRFTVINDFIF